MILRASRKHWLLILLGCVVFAAGSIEMIQTGADVAMRGAPFGDVRSWGVAGLVLFGLGIPTSILRMVGRWNFLLLNRQGFLIASALRPTKTYRWGEVTGFHTRAVYYRGFKTRESVVFDVGASWMPGHQTLQALVNALGISLPDTYGLKAKDLAALMNGWHDRNTRGIA